MCVGAPAVSLTTLNVVLMVLTFLEPFRSLFYLTNTMGVFQKYLSLWVALCMAVGAVVSKRLVDRRRRVAAT